MNGYKNNLTKEDAKFLNDFAITMSKEGLHTEAIACLKKALRIEPENSKIWFNLGLSLYETREQDLCIYAFTQSIKFNPIQPDAWDSLALVLYEKGNMSEAKKAYNRAIKLEPNNGRIWNNYGTFLFHQESYIEAQKAFESAIALEPNFGDAIFNLRDTYVELGKHDLAEKCNIILKEIHYHE